MHETEHAASFPALAVALSLAAGILATSLARHLRIPGIVLLLAAGVLLGPDVLDVVQPQSLGPALHVLVGFAVAVILFEGGLNLNLRRLRREARSIRRLVTLGAAVTALGAGLAARFLLEWEWTPSILFGTLVIVTGPTVITPLLRRIRVQRKLATVLEAEGVLIDAVGAVVAVVALQVAISPSREAVALAAWGVVTRLGFGIVAGLVCGLVMAFFLRIERLVPEGLENIFTLSLALALFQASNAVLPESGIMSVIVAGLVVGNVRARVLGDLREFKEQLTVMLIGMLFVLLAADVRIDDVRSLGWPGVWTVVVIMVIVRPLNVILSTVNSDLNVREKAFLCWLAPRGIVAAAIASLAAQTLELAGIAGGQSLRAMVFLVIGATVLIQGLTGPLVARLLGVRRASGAGYVILGANDLGRAIGRSVAEAGQDVVFLESNPDACRAAEADGLRVLYGIGLDDTLLQRSELDGRAGAVAVTPNDGINLHFARKAREDFKVPNVWVALRRGHMSVTKQMIQDARCRVLFGEPRSLEVWTLRLERGIAQVERWRRISPPDPEEGEEAVRPPADVENIVLPMTVRRGRRISLVDEETSFKAKDESDILVFLERREAAHEWLASSGWEPVSGPLAEAPEGEPLPAT